MAVQPPSKSKSGSAAKTPIVPAAQPVRPPLAAVPPSSPAAPAAGSSPAVPEGPAAPPVAAAPAAAPRSKAPAAARATPAAGSELEPYTQRIPAALRDEWEARLTAADIPRGAALAVAMRRALDLGDDALDEAVGAEVYAQRKARARRQAGA